jgi:PTS system nitrogen regulatory IIA component
MEDHDILTIEEVAQYLRVSERTVYDWANKGTIPSGKLGTTWRFKKTDIENWVDEKLSGNVQSNPSVTSISIQDILIPERITFMNAATKHEALEHVASCLATSDAVTDASALQQEITIREELMSTGIGFQVAVPHVRLPSVTNVVMAIGINQTPIADYESLDNESIQIICMLAARHDQHALYLKALGKISAALKMKEKREALLSLDNAQAAYLILTH